MSEMTNVRLLFCGAAQDSFGALRCAARGEEKRE